MNNPKLASNIRSELFLGLEGILGDEGIMLAEGGFTASPAQCDYSQHFAEAIARASERRALDKGSLAGVMLASADTGTGKTVGYGVPLLLKAALIRQAVENGPQVAISTHSHALQKQFIGTPEQPGDIVKIAGWVEALGYPKPTIARRLGKQAFVSLSAFEALAQQMQDKRSELGLSALDLTSLDPIYEFAAAANEGKSSGLIEDLKEYFGGALPLKISAASICLATDSDDEDAFAYNAHLDVASQADVIIISHAYLASCALYNSGKISDRGVACLVVDEADMLSDVAASTFRFEISLRRGSAMLDKLPGSAAKLAKKAMDAVADYTQSLYSKVEAITVDEIAQTSQDTLFECVSVANKAIKQITANKKTRLAAGELNELNQYSTAFDKFLRGDQKSTGTDKDKKGMFASAISFSPVKNLPSLIVMPLNPGRIMSRLWSLYEPKEGPNAGVKTCDLTSVLLTSATLGAPGRYPDALDRFKDVSNTLGVNLESNGYHKAETDLWCHFEPESFGAVKFILADPSTPNPTMGMDEDSNAVINDAWIDYAVTMVSKAKEAGGRTLVLSRSYKDTRILAEKLVKAGVIVIEQMRGQSSNDCVAKFLADKSAVWISPTAWEGLNLPGAIANVVITRLPFQTLSTVDKALLKAYGEFKNKDIQSISHAKMMNATKRKLRQGMFRAIRSKNDKSRIYVADPRFPLSNLSLIPLKHAAEIRYSGVRSYAGLHAVIPERFQRALQNAEVLKMDGKLLK